MAESKLLKWIPQKSAKIQFEEWTKEQERKGWQIELRASLLSGSPKGINLDMLAGPFVGNENLKIFLKDITGFRESENSQEESITGVEIQVKRGVTFYFLARPEKYLSGDTWGNRVAMGDQIVLNSECQYIGFVQVNKKNKSVRISSNKTFWDQSPLSCLDKDNIPEFLAWVDKFQCEPGVGAIISAIRGRNVWIENEVLFACFYLTTNKPAKEWAPILDLWLDEVNS